MYVATKPHMATSGIRDQFTMSSLYLPHQRYNVSLARKQSCKHVHDAKIAYRRIRSFEEDAPEKGRSNGHPLEINLKTLTRQARYITSRSNLVTLAAYSKYVPGV